MSTADLLHTQKYFRDEEHREPTITELRMLDTYWSDHCRHTTFMSKIAEVSFDEGTEVIEDTYKTYLKASATKFTGVIPSAPSLSWTSPSWA